MMFCDDEVAYNRFTNLDGIEDKIIFYLISEKNKSPQELKLVHTLWRLLFYSDKGCLIEDEEHPLPTYKQIAQLIDNDGVHQEQKRIFRYPYVDDSFGVECSMLRIYIDKISPTNHLISSVNIGIEVITNTKIVNIMNNLYDENDEFNNPTEQYPLITYKNRCTIMLKTILALLNGKDIAGVGKVQFNKQANTFSETNLNIWNTKSFFGYQTYMSCLMSGVK